MTQVTFDIETTGLNPLHSRITCICGKVLFGNNYMGSHIDEKSLIKDFIKWLKNEKVKGLISANGKDFDLQFIFVRSYILGINIEDILFLKELNHFDILSDITDKKVSLNNLARIYRFELKSGNGINAIKLFEEMKLNELMDYCMDDVELTEKIYLKYKEILK